MKNRNNREENEKKKGGKEGKNRTKFDKMG